MVSFSYITSFYLPVGYDKSLFTHDCSEYDRFGLPYTKDVLGNPRCQYKSQVGYDSSKKNNFWVKCKEDCPSQYVSGKQKWRETSSQCKRTCDSVGLTQDNVLESCNNYRIKRTEKKWKIAGCDSGYQLVQGAGASVIGAALFNNIVSGAAALEDFANVGAFCEGGCVRIPVGFVTIEYCQ